MNLLEVLELIGARLQEIDRVLRVCIVGLNSVKRSVGLIEAVVDYKRTQPDADPGALDREVQSARRDAEFADVEVTRGFPTLYSQASIATWAVLEAGVEDIVVACLGRRPALLRNDALASIKIPLAEYEALDQEERLRLLVNELARQTKADLKAGVTKFETLLGVVGLGGAVDRDASQALFELWSVRNLLVHRAGIVDRRFTDACPWVQVTPGVQLAVSHEAYGRYRDAANRYGAELLVRILVWTGYSREEAERSIRKRKGDEASGETPV